MAELAPASRPSPIRVLWAALWTAVVGGVLCGSVLGAVVAHLNLWSPGSDLLLLCAYLSGLYAAVFAVGLLGLALCLLALGGRPGARVFWAVLLGFCVFLTGALRFSPAIQIFSVVPSMNLIGVVDLVLVGIASLAVTGAVLSDRRIRVLGASLTAIVIFAGLEAFAVWHETPHRRDLVADLAPLVSGAHPPERAPPAERFAGAKLVVLAFDGLAWDVLIPLLERGDLPMFAAAINGSAYGYLDTLRFTVSPVVWESIDTGQPETRHGIGHHFHFAFPGLSQRVTHLPNMRLCNTPMGLRRLLAATHGLGLWHSTPSSSNDARVARIWEIFSRSGMKVGVYSMLNTTPAAPINGFLRGYGVTPPVEYPRDLEAGLPKLPAVPPVGVHPGPGWVAEMEPYEQALWNRFVTLSLERHPDVLMYYTHFGDGVNHVNWKVETVGDGIFYSGIGRGGYQPGPASIEVNRFLDHIVGDTLRRLPDDALLVIVSDHGFDFRGYEHDNSPPGVLIVRGPGIEDGLIEGGSIYDVAPTLLHLLGLPVADDMVGRVLPVARAGGPLDRKVAHLASYGASEQTKPEGAADAKELRDLESYLRSLGYVVD